MSAIQTWVIDDEHTVHTPSCAGIVRGATPYAVKIPNDGEMAEHLARPDAYRPLGSTHTHSGAPRIKACKRCVNIMIDEQTIS